MTDLPSPKIKDHFSERLYVSERRPQITCETKMNTIKADNGDHTITKPEWQRVIKNGRPPGQIKSTTSGIKTYHKFRK